jgi:hypothetical protein
VFDIGAVLFVVALIIDLLQIYSTKRNRKVAVAPSTKRRQNFYRQFSLVLAWGATALGLAAVIADTDTGNILQTTSGGSVFPGQSALGMLWATWALSFMFSTGWTIMHRSKSGVVTTSGARVQSSFDTY